MKTKEELKALKEEVETVNRKLHELTDEELAQVPGGFTTYPDGHGTGSSGCPNNHTKCTEANCMNPQCTHLVINDSVVSNEYSCGKSVPGFFHIWHR